LTLCALFPLEAPLFQKYFGARADPLPGKNFSLFYLHGEPRAGSQQ
jgi:hypothetical protein